MHGGGEHQHQGDRTKMDEDLVRAAWFGDGKGVKRALDGGANVDAIDEYGMKPV